MVWCLNGNTPLIAPVLKNIHSDDRTAIMMIMERKIIVVVS
jgi:hypothetical protein